MKIVFSMSKFDNMFYFAPTLFLVHEEDSPNIWGIAFLFFTINLSIFRND